MSPREWHRTITDQTYLISTARTQLPHDFVQTVFEDPSVYWAKAISPENMQLMLDNSCTLGLYTKNSKPSAGNQTRPIPIGIARIITDYVTFAYLTDVYVHSDYRGLGLGRWLIGCCREVMEDMPELRRVMLMTSSAHAKRFYREEMGLQILEQGTNGLVAMSGRKEDLKAVGQKEGSNNPASAE
ncbi:hypothetical protein K432DRAFT_295033 [Lepidopterella palustris CBS 459.81]|uniref:N-acetyltransferase domain-containing protein n=1 Tax=Lepidopterella palustris CBS 459.81 TaxID=1314670 RepID=A0A8E2ECX0_9PEZI|nr:hypothetical protein K432DRAFT_295033 [Lepidopterella palustris CBS 459.81]